MVGRRVASDRRISFSATRVDAADRLRTCGPSIGRLGLRYMHQTVTKMPASSTTRIGLVQRARRAWRTARTSSTARSSASSSERSELLAAFAVRSALSAAASAE